MKKKRSKQNSEPIVLPDTCEKFWTSRGFDFFIQAIQLGLGGIAVYGVMRLLCAGVCDPLVLDLTLLIFLLAPVLCVAGWTVETLLKKRYSKPHGGLTEDQFYLQDGIGVSVPLDRIGEIQYRFGQLRKGGKYACLVLHQKVGKPVEVVLPSLELIWALRKTLPSVKWTIPWVSRLVVCLLIGASVGGLVSLVFLMQ